MAAISQEIKNAIASDFARGGISYRELVVKHGVSLTSVARVINGAGIDASEFGRQNRSRRMRTTMLGNQNGRGNAGKVRSLEQRRAISKGQRGRKQSQATKNRRARALANVNFYKPTKIELSVQQALNEIGVEYTVHKQFLVSDGDKLLRIVPDIYMPLIDTVIEVNGCYWHDCHICYPDGIRPDRRTSDDHRRSLLLTQVSVVHEIWQHELSTPHEAVMRAFETIRDQDVPAV